VTEPADREGGSRSPGEGEVPSEGGDNPLTEDTVMLTGEITASVARVMWEALSEAATGAVELALLAPLQHKPVRAAEPAPVTAAQLQLPEGAEELLGSKVETQVVTGGAEIRVWVAGAIGIEAGSRIDVVAMTSEGSFTAGTTVAAGAEGDIELSLSWDSPHAPEVLAFGVERLADE
jgi:hypothetical protein